MQERCDEIAADIKRHVDNVGSVGIEFDQEHVCEHCGWTWTEQSDTYNGGCCSKDEENAPQETGEPAKMTDLRHVETGLSDEEKQLAILESRRLQQIRDLGDKWLGSLNYSGHYQPVLTNKLH